MVEVIFATSFLNGLNNFFSTFDGFSLIMLNELLLTIIISKLSFKYMNI